jgi:Domain of unknown function (DUF397)
MAISVKAEELSNRDSVQSPRFRRSSFCSEMNCVEVAAASDGSILLRDTKDESGSILRFTEQEWTGFLRGASAGEFSRSALTQRS